MDIDKLYEIKNGAVTLYVDQWLGTEFRFKAFTVSNDPDSFFVDSGILEKYCPDDRKIVRIVDYLYEHYRGEADVQLLKCIKRNINNYDSYSKIDENEFRFWNKAINTAGLEP